MNLTDWCLKAYSKIVKIWQRSSFQQVEEIRVSSVDNRPWPRVYTWQNLRLKAAAEQTRTTSKYKLSG